MMPVKALVLRLAPRVRWLRTAQALPAPVLRELLALELLLEPLREGRLAPCWGP